MTLFSTFIQFNVLLLFLYLGLFFGIVFNLTKLFINFLKKQITKKYNLTKELFNNKLHNAKATNKKIKNKKNFLKLTKNLLEFFLNFILVANFTLAILTTFFINLKYNFGDLSVYYILIWVISFYLGHVFVKTVAKFIINFYNYFNKRVKKNDG